MGALLRGKMMDALRDLYSQRSLESFAGFADPQAFDKLMQRLARTKWVVYAKKPFHRVDHVLKYLGRYTHRVAIANSRLVDVRDDVVAFRTKNGKIASLTPVEFLRRFVQHVLPDGFKKIRHYGLYAGAAEDVRHEAQRQLDPTERAVPVEVATPELSWIDVLRELTGRDVEHCPHCGQALEHRVVISGWTRAPPRALVST
jgi:hypothetical protein